MIGKVDRGWDAPGLVSYLMGPGKANEHTRPTVIAAWHNDPGALQPTMVGDGDFDFHPAELAELRAHVQAPADAVGLPRRQPEEGSPGYTKHGYVWHASIAIPAGDGALDHDTWAQIARDVMDRTGIAAADDPGGCRWIAVHHGASAEGNDHIHIAATLVRQDTGTRVHPRNDFVHLRTVLREWEDRLGITVTAQNARDADRPATRGEQEKAARRAEEPNRFVPPRTDPTETVRGQLRQAVAETAATSTDSEGFLAGLRERGLLVHLHHDRAGVIDGYAVAMPDDRNRSGQPIFYGGGKLARDLSWPKLAAEFTRHGGVPVAERPAQQSWTFAATQLTGARDVVVRATGAFKYTPYSAQRDIAVAAHRLVATHTRLTTTGSPTDGDAHGTRVAAVWAGHRSARSARLSPHTGHTGRVGTLATELNAASRNLLALRAISEHGPARTASLELIVALAELMAVIADWHTGRGQSGSAAAARDCGWQLRSQTTTAAAHPATAGTRTESAARGPVRGAAPPAPGRAPRAAPPPHGAPHRRPPTPPTTGPTR